MERNKCLHETDKSAHACRQVYRWLKHVAQHFERPWHNYNSVKLPHRWIEIVSLRFTKRYEKAKFTEMKNS